MKTIQLFYSLLLFCVLLISACGNSKKAMNSESDESQKDQEETIEIVFTYKQTMCFGKCPVYNFTVYDNGHIAYEGKDFSRMQGEWTKTISQERLNELKDFFLELKFFDFEDVYTDNVMDLPTIFIGFNHEGKSKRIEAYFDVPEDVRRMGRELRLLVDEEEGWNKVQND